MQAHHFKMYYRRNILQNTEEFGYIKGQTEKGYLLKYYPKYYKKLELKKIDRPTALKIKGLKRLHHMNGVLEKSQPSSLGTVLVQKLWKDFRTLPMIYKEREWALIEEKRWYGEGFKEIRQLAGLERIQVPQEFLKDPFLSPEWNLRNSNRNVNRVLAYLAYNERLKKINAKTGHQISEFIESKLNRCKRLREKFSVRVSLDSLYGFDISGFHIKDSVISQNITFLGTWLCQIDVLKDLTTLLNLFQNLKIIKVIPNGYVSSCLLSDTELNQMTLDFYKSLEKLPNLGKLSLGFTGDSLAWIKNFALPKSLKFLKMKFFASEKKSFVPNIQVQDALILKSFCSKIQELPGLETLQLSVSASSGDPVPIRDFMYNLLQGIPRLHSLILKLPSGNASSKNSDNAPLDLSLIFKGIQHLTPFLRKLHLSDTWDNEMTFSLSPKYKFPNLLEFRLNGKIDCLFDLKQALMMVSDRPHLSTLQQRVEIRSIRIVHLAFLSLLLKELQKMSPFKPHIELKLHLQFSPCDQKDLEDMVKTFMNFIKTGGSMKGLALRISVKESTRLDDLFKAFQENPIVENFEVAILDSYDCGKHWYEFKKGTMIQKYEESEEDG